ncbi:MAG TPA: carbohydrate kinase [Tepidisphaeraceae bacterium]|nr:carbohydrate kinase [Tepidisphaeraceae bacterium]
MVETSIGKRPVVVGIGEILWDLLPSGKQLGGAVTNFAYHAQALGAEGIVASCVGKDALGQEILQRLDSLHLTRQYIALHPQLPTGTVEVRVDEKGIPDFIIHQNVAWDAIPTSEDLLALAARADAVCFGSLAQRAQTSRETIRRFLAGLRKQCLRVFDINLRQSYFTRDIVHESLAIADVLKLNDQELPALGKLLQLKGTASDLLAQLMRQYPLRMIALTRGGQGSQLFADRRVFEHPGYLTTVVDTVGAGDAFTAALTIGLLRKDDPAKINDSANRLASYVCSQPGATPPIPKKLP